MVSSSVAGIGELLDFVWDYLAGAARMPKTVLKGQEGGTVTGAQYDVMNYYSRITAIQENQLRPHLEYLMRCLMWAEDECGGRLALIQSNGPLNSIRYGTLIARQMQRLKLC